MTQLNMLEPQPPERDPLEGLLRTGRSLSVAQRAHIGELLRMLGATNVALLGFDGWRSPVISRRDANGVKTYSVHGDGRGIHVIPPVVQLTDPEVESFDPDDLQFIYRLPRRLAGAEEAT